MNITNAWKEGSLPIINGIVYANGCVEQVEFTTNNDIKTSIVLKKSHINDIAKNNISDLVINHKLVVLDKKINIYCGEGSWGGDGFIVVESLEKKQIIWAAFFEYSNPFNKIEMINNNVIATNNLNEKWQFNFEKPSEITIKL